MRTYGFSIACILLAVALAVGQVNTQNSDARFEVASVKPVGNSAPLGYSGGPGSEDPGRITYTRVTMLTLLREAFGLKRDQISGPNWIADASYSIVATLQPKTSESELRQMHLNLLIDRFGLSYDRLSKEDRGYELRVDRSGPKLTNKTSDSGRATGGISSSDTSWIWQRNVEGEMVHLSFKDASIGAVVDALNRGLTPVPVVDKTGLTGKYTFEFVYENTGSPEFDIVAAVRKQLGLQLIETKLLREYIVIDHLATVPIGN